MTAKVEPRVVEAVGTSVGLSIKGGKGLAQLMERAMSQAVLDAAKDDVTDPDEIRARMRAAQREIKLANNQGRLDLSRVSKA